jgi:hypothetical protein
MRKVLLSTVAALFTAPLMGLPAWASACITDTVSDYQSLGSGGCTVDGGAITFSNFSVTTIGDVTLGDFSVVNPAPGEYGLDLNYIATATQGSEADVSWTYNVSGNLLDDAYASLAGTVSDSGAHATLGETLSNGVTLSLLGPGSTTVTFTPIASLGVIKDQHDFVCSSCTNSISETSDMTNAFSLTATPIPGALPLFATGLAGLWGLRRKRKTTGRLNSGPVIAS